LMVQVPAREPFGYLPHVLAAAVSAFITSD
jgi:hypothetical protein